MKVLAHSLVFPTPRHVLEPGVLDLLRELGFDGVEVVPVDYSVADLEELRRKLEARGLVSVLGWSLDEQTNPIGAEPAAQAAALSKWRSLIDAARTLGAPLVAGLNQAASGYVTGAPPTERELASAVDVYRAACDYALEGGSRVTLCLEPSVRSDSHLLNTVAQARRFLDRVQRPNAKLLLDTFQMLREEDDLARAIEQAGPDLGYFHWSESHRGIVGNGTVPWNDVRKGLARSGYSGWSAVEAFADPGASVASRAQVWRSLSSDAASLLGQSRRFIQRLMSSGGES